MKNKIVAIYPKPDEPILYLDGEKKLSEEKIVENVSRLTNVSPIIVKKLVKKYKAKLKDSYRPDLLEDYVFNAALMVRSIDDDETI